MTEYYFDDKFLNLLGLKKKKYRLTTISDRIYHLSVKKDNKLLLPNNLANYMPKLEYDIKDYRRRISNIILQYVINNYTNLNKTDFKLPEEIHIIL